MSTLDRLELTDLCRHALRQAGAGPHAAQVLAEATVEAEFVGTRAVGVAHLFDYLAAYRAGRITVDVEPAVHRPVSAVIDVDARGGLAQTAYAAAFEELVRTTRVCGLATLWIKNSFTCGELGYYPRRLAQQGLIAVAAANSSALMSLGGAPSSVLGTNPLAYALPRPDKVPVVIDQASSSTAFVNIRRAAETGDPIPDGWALGPDGEPTRDAGRAVQGTLLPFGGHRGGNIALLVEVLATLSGASFSVDAAPFDRGDASPGIGVFVLTIDPGVFPGSSDRLARQLESLRDEHQVRLPAIELTALPEVITIDDGLIERLRAAARR